jgi:hypothetical protein
VIDTRETSTPFHRRPASSAPDNPATTRTVPSGGRTAGGRSAADPGTPDDRGEYDAVPTERLEAQVCELAARAAAALCRWLLMVAELDRRRAWADWQMTSCAHWLSWRCGLGLVTARDHVRVAHALTRLPRIRDEFAAGRLSYSKVRAITRIATPALERELVHLALASTAAQTERLVRGYRRAGTEPATTPGPTAHWHLDPDGYLIVEARLAPDDGLALATALDRLRHTPPPTPDKPPPDKPAPDKPAQRLSRAEAFTLLARSALAIAAVDHSGADRHLVHIHVDHDVLAEPDPTTSAGDSAESPQHQQTTADSDRPTDPAGAPVAGHAATAPPADPSPTGQPAPAVTRGQAHFANGPAITATMARRLLCDGLFRIWSHDAHTGRPLDHGRRHRTITPAQRRHLLQRDHGCAVPGCSNTRFVDAHHVIHWLYGGRTDLDNPQGRYLVLASVHDEHDGADHQGYEAHRRHELPAGADCRLADRGSGYGSGVSAQRGRLGVDDGPGVSARVEGPLRPEPFDR